MLSPSVVVSVPLTAPPPKPLLRPRFSDFSSVVSISSGTTRSSLSFWSHLRPTPLLPKRISDTFLDPTTQEYSWDASVHKGEGVFGSFREHFCAFSSRDNLRSHPTSQDIRDARLLILVDTGGTTDHPKYGYICKPSQNRLLQLPQGLLSDSRSLVY